MTSQFSICDSFATLQLILLPLILGFIPSTLSTDDLRSTILSDEFSVDRETRLAYVSSGNWIRRHLKGYFGENYLCETQKTVFSRENNNAFVIQLYGLLSEFDAR